MRAYSGKTENDDDDETFKLLRKDRGVGGGDEESNFQVRLNSSQFQFKALFIPHGALTWRPKT